MKKIFNEIVKEVNLFNCAKNYSIEPLFNNSSMAVDNSIIIHVDIKPALELFDNLLMHFKYKYNLKITYCTINHNFKITK